jgi:hypothetical protein
LFEESTPMRKVFWLTVCIAVSITLLNAAPVSACDPEGENLANRATDPQCRLVLPVRAVPSPRAVLASANPVSSVVDYATHPACFLPDGSIATTVLGVGEECPPPFLPPRTIKTPVATATPVTKATPRGDSPLSARVMTGEWETIPPGGQVWYRIDNQNNFFLDIWMDTYGKPGVVFNVYSPEQTNNLSASTIPKGRSAPSKEGHDWGWKGAQAMGVWHVLVMNTTNSPMQYRIDHRQSTMERECRSYWEWLPTGQYVYWTACRDYGP